MDHHERILEFKYGPLYNREKNKGDKGQGDNRKGNRQIQITVPMILDQREEFYDAVDTPIIRHHRGARGMFAN